MKPLFYLTSALLGLDGLLHIVKISSSGFNSATMLPWIVTGLFGIAYLVIAFLVFRRSRQALWASLIAPLIGLLLTLLGMKPNPDSYTISFIVLDALVIGLSAYLLFVGRASLGRVR
jgi:hypothetical protein